MIDQLFSAGVQIVLTFCALASVAYVVLVLTFLTNTRP